MVNKVGDTFFPGSKTPFRPINPYGARANVPEGWKNPLKEKLYQVFVDDQKRGQIPIGPKIRFDVATQLCSNTNIAIKAGKISGWSSAHISPAPAEQVRWGQV